MSTLTSSNTVVPAPTFVYTRQFSSTYNHVYTPRQYTAPIIVPHRRQQSRYTSYDIVAPALTSFTSAPSPLSPRPQHHSFFQPIVFLPLNTSFSFPICTSRHGPGESIPHRHQIATWYIPLQNPPPAHPPLKLIPCFLRHLARSAPRPPQLTLFAKATSPGLAQRLAFVKV